MAIDRINLNSRVSYNPNFGARQADKKLLVLLLKKPNELFGKCTKGHLKNTFFETNLNDALRHPETQILDELQYMAANNIARNSIYTGIVQRYIKTPSKENPNILKQKLNEEFSLLPGLVEKRQYYRGIENISDKEWHNFAGYRKGQVVCPDKGYAFITNFVEDANLYNRGNNGVLFEIECPEGSQISQLKGFVPSRITKLSFKNESVVPAGSLYEVTKDSAKDENGILHVYLRFLNRWE